MRITNNILRDHALANIQRGLEQIGVAQQRVSTGLKLNRASDDPAAAATTMRARGSIRAIEQYRRAIDMGKMRTEAEEGVLSDISEILGRVKALATAEISASSNEMTRTASRKEVEGLFRHVVYLANTQVNGDYVFGGNNATTKPFEVDASGATLAFTSTNPTGEPLTEISNGELVPTTHSGQAVFGTTSSGVLRDLQDMMAALSTGDVSALTTSLRSLDSSMNRVEALIIDSGIRTNHLELTRANLDAVETHLLTLKSDLEEVDIEEAVTDLVSRQTAFQAAMLATSKVMGLTLTDYLR